MFGADLVIFHVSFACLVKTAAKHTPTKRVGRDQIQEERDRDTDKEREIDREIYLKRKEM